MGLRVQALAGLFLVFAITVRASVYYVDSAHGRDTNAGTSVNAPWQTLSKVNDTHFHPGDTVLFRRGSAWIGELKITSSGDSMRPVLFGAYGTGNKPVITNPQPPMGSAITIKANWVIIENFLVADAREAGIYIGTGASRNIIRNNEATRVGLGIAVDGDFNRITGNYLHDLHMVVDTEGGDDDYGAVGVWLGPVSGGGKASDNEIAFNRMVNCMAKSKDYETDGGAVEFYRNVDRNYVHHNWMENCNGAFEVGGNGDTVSDNRIACNVLINNGYAGSFHGASKYGVTIGRFRVENNVIVETRAQEQLIGFWSGTVTPEKFIYRNNIFYCPNYKAISKTGSFTHEYNLYYLGGRSEIGYPPGVGEKTGDPLFAGLENHDFHLKTGSPAIDAGISLGDGADFDGRRVPLGRTTDMGAYESDPGHVDSGYVASLAGEWRFAADSLVVGERQHWEKARLPGVIHLPGSTDEIGLGNHFPLFRSILGQKPPEDYPRDADFGMLTREHKFMGVAWYQKDVVIPEQEGGKLFSLCLERVMWRSRVFVDGLPAGGPVDFLSSPHRHPLGVLTAGKHTITVMIDNRQVYPVGILAHSYCPHMQTMWNGAVGKIELVGQTPLHIGRVDAYSSYRDGTVRIRMEVNNPLTREQTVPVKWVIRERQGGRVVAEDKANLQVAPGSTTAIREIRLKEPPEPWNEFTPNLYDLTTTGGSDGQVAEQLTTFGFRDLGVTDKHFTINGQKILYRNSHEGMFFGKTGYPAMDKEYWLRVFGVYKAHGLNSARFHSACPPGAAFDAADELGIYLQVEFFWMDGWMGYKDLIGRDNDTLNRFVRSELMQAIREYGNHPSMVLVGIGNELGGNFEKMGEWIGEARKEDPRHLYAAGIAHNITVADQWVEYGGKGEALKHPGTGWNYTYNYTVPTAHNYDKEFRRKELPEFTHETGQYIVHPLWSEMDKYTGPLKPYNFQYFKKLAQSSEIAGQDLEFQKASGNLNSILYKAEIEATLRTPQSAGYGLLSMVDYPGQGEAFIGWVDPFYENKSFMPADQFRMYGGHTVPLLQFEKWVWEDGDTLKARAKVANYGPGSIDQAVMTYRITDGSSVIRSGAFPVAAIAQGGLTGMGDFSEILHSGPNGRQLTISLEIEGTPYRNSWNIWVFPKGHRTEVPKDVLVTSRPEEALRALHAGKKVVLDAHRLGPRKNQVYAAFAPVFWSATWFTGQETEVTGAVIRNTHPALSRFPTGEVTDWQWQDICRDARGFVLNDLPAGYRPIVQPVDDYHFGKKLGSMFELRTAEGGKLLVCGYNLTDTLPYPAARQLRASILSYAGSDQFNPGQLVDDEWLLKTFPDLYVPLKKPAGYEKAWLYVKAGDNFETLNAEGEWTAGLDGAVKEKGLDYRVTCSGVWRDDKGSYWFGKVIKIEIDVSAPAIMTLKLRFLDSNNQGRTGIVRCEDMPGVTLGHHPEGEWISIPITKENCLDGKLVIIAECKSGPNLMISDLILIPD